MHECNICGLVYEDNEHYYDDICDECAKEEGLPVYEDD